MLKKDETELEEEQKQSIGLSKEKALQWDLAELGLFSQAK